MKIAVNTRFLLPQRLEGIGWFTYEVCKRLVEWHPEHEFIFLFDRKFSDEFVFGENVKPLAIFPQARHPFLFYWWFEWSLPRVLRREKADLFFSPDGFLSLRSKVPTLVTIHDIAWQHFPKQVPKLHRKHYEYFMPRFAKRADRITTVSEYSKQDIIKYLDSPADKIDVVYDGCNSDFRPMDAAEQEAVRKKYTNGNPYLLYVGSIHPRKNVPRMLEAFDQFKESNPSPLKLVLAGRMAWQSGEVGQTVNKLKHRADVVFLGYTSTEELPKVVASAFGVLYLSLFEGFGIPILEAMHCDVPVITSNISSMPEVAGDAALLVDPYSIDSIQQQMQRLWTDEKGRKELIEKAKVQRQQFSWDRTAKLVWQSIGKLTKERQSK